MSAATTHSGAPASAPGPLLDPRLGIVPALVRRSVPAHLPASFVHVAARAADSRRFCAWASDTEGAGCSFDGAQAAAAAAVGEAVERYCGNLPSALLRHACHDELVAAGHDAVHPRALALFSPEQHVRPHFPFAPFTPATKVQWAPGHDLVDERRRWVPAAVVWPSLALAAPARGEPVVVPVLQPGLATGGDRASARASALLEVLERDAVTLAWHGRAGLRPLEVDDDVAALGAGPCGVLRTTFVRFACRAGVVVAGALVEDQSTGRLAMGTAARTSARPAARRALAEALQLLLLLEEYDEPDGPVARAASAPASPLKPFRADRGYGRSYAGDLSDVRDYGCHLQLFLDPQVQARFADELAEALAEGGQARTGFAPPAGATVGAGELVAQLGDGVQAACAVDVTTADVRAAGLHVMRVVVPGTVANAAAGLPLLGSTRLEACLQGRPRRVLPLPH